MNQLNVNQQEAIVGLSTRGWSARRIARELGVNRETVGKYLRAVQAKPATAPEVTLGLASQDEVKVGAAPPETTICVVAKPATVTLGSEGNETPKPATEVTLGSAEGKSSCAAWRGPIEAGLVQRLSAKRIHQDLKAEHGFTGSYQAVKRFVRRFEAKTAIPFRRMECSPADEMQVDFGQGAWVKESGKRRRPHLFRAVLSYSRKGYSEVVWRQDTETFIRCLENALRFFGGSVRTIVIDNLKAGVLQADWYDPELNPKIKDFAQHYTTVILPTKPAMPRHKGKIESGVNYAQENAVKGRSFTSLAEQNIFLSEWEKNVADTRLHGTMRQQVGPLFRTVEQPALLPLPASLFPSFKEGKRSVHLDGYVEFDKAYYSAPPEYVGREIWVRGESHLIRLFNVRREPIGVHARAEVGRFATKDEHIHSQKRHVIERGADHLLDRCRQVGPGTGAWAQAMYQHRGVEGLRVMQGLIHLARKHPVGQLERAAIATLTRAAWRLRDIRNALSEPANLVQVDFLETHPLIRNLDCYRVPFPS
jgi:transposase